MTKRILSIIVATVMLASCFVFTASAEDTRYEGIKYFQSAEDMLASLNADSAASNSSMWDYAARREQQDILDAAAAALDSDFTGAGLVEKWAPYCARVLTRDNDGNIINYIKMLNIYNTDDSSLNTDQLAVKSQFAAKYAEYDVEGLGLRDSLAKLDNYMHEMGVIISRNRATLNAYNLSEEDKTKHMLDGTYALYQIAFNSTAESFSNGFNSDFLGDDNGKKLISVMYGKALTTELATDNISKVLVSYVNNNFVAVKNDFAVLVKSAYGEATEKAIFDFFKNTLAKAYEVSSVSDEAKTDIKLLFGKPEVAGDKGALQLMFETMESSKAGEYGLINIWFNLFLRQHTQLVVRGTDAVTLGAGVDADANRISVRNNSSAVFAVKALDRYGVDGINDNLLSLGSDWLDLKVYNEDGTENTFVVYSKSEGKFHVYIDSSKPDTYPGYVQLVRNDGAYIETYPIVVQNKAQGVNPPSYDQDPEENKFKLTYVTNGGTLIPDEYYNPGTKVNLTKVPVKDGYVFEGWYSDAGLTNNVTEVVMTSNKIVYANWVKDNGTAGPGTPTPEILNSDDHFAYVIGYPDGTVLPENNISRAEVATIFFRLLKAEVRNENLSSVNTFDDVEDDDWYNTAVSTLAKLGIVTGRNDKVFDPNAPITRAEFATICARFDDSEYIITDNFTDISSHWAVSYIREAAARGWIKGYEDNTFRPDRHITRAESMTLINRVLNRAPESSEDLLPDMISWPDNKVTAWYYLAVQEATNSHDYVKKNNVYEKWVKINEGTDWTQYQ